MKLRECIDYHQHMPRTLMSSQIVVIFGCELHRLIHRHHDHFVPQISLNSISNYPIVRPCTV
jgi:hypothetical protein